jgi:hypothetical protein
VLGKPYEPVEKDATDKAADDAAGKTNGEKADDAAKDKAPLTTDKTVGPTAMKD